MANRLSGRLEAITRPLPSSSITWVRSAILGGQCRFRLDDGLPLVLPVEIDAQRAQYLAIGPPLAAYGGTVDEHVMILVMGTPGHLTHRIVVARCRGPRRAKPRFARKVGADEAAGIGRIGAGHHHAPRISQHQVAI